MALVIYSHHKFTICFGVDSLSAVGWLMFCAKLLLDGFLISMTYSFNQLRKIWPIIHELGDIFAYIYFMIYDLNFPYSEAEKSRSRVVCVCVCACAYVSQKKRTKTRILHLPDKKCIKNQQTENIKMNIYLEHFMRWKPYIWQMLVKYGILIPFHLIWFLSRFVRFLFLFRWFHSMQAPQSIWLAIPRSAFSLNIHTTHRQSYQSGFQIVFALLKYNFDMEY